MSLLQQVNLRSYFTPQAIARRLSRMKPLKSSIVDRLYPESKRDQHPLAVVGLSEIMDVTRAVPVVRRGAMSVPLGGNSTSIEYIEPQPVKVSDFMSATDINNYKLLSEMGRDALIQRSFEKMRKTVRATTEALASQSMTGTISYPIKIDGGGLDTYTVAFGATGTFDASAALWDAAGTDIDDILLQFIDIEAQVQDEAGVSSVKFMAGRLAYASLLKKAQGATKDSSVTVVVGDKNINIGGYIIEMMNESYFDPATQAMVKKVAEDQLVAYSDDAPNRLIYCALDDLNANLQPLPFFAIPYEEKDPSGIKILGQSKPLPVPDPKSICWATVTS